MEILSAQSPEDPGTLIVGQWELDFDESLAQASDQTMARFHQLSQTLQDNIKAGFDGQILQCHQQGELTIQSPNGKTQTGSWSLSDDQLQLHLIIDGENDKILTIMALTSDRMALNLGEDDIESALFKNWHYKKL